MDSTQNTARSAFTCVSGCIDEREKYSPFMEQNDVVELNIPQEIQDTFPSSSVLITGVAQTTSDNANLQHSGFHLISQRNACWWLLHTWDQFLLPQHKNDDPNQLLSLVHEEETGCHGKSRHQLCKCPFWGVYLSPSLWHSMETTHKWWKNRMILTSRDSMWHGLRECICTPTGHWNYYWTRVDTKCYNAANKPLWQDMPCEVYYYFLGKKITRSHLWNWQRSVWMHRQGHHMKGIYETLCMGAHTDIRNTSRRDAKKNATQRSSTMDSIVNPVGCGCFRFWPFYLPEHNKGTKIIKVSCIFFSFVVSFLRIAKKK